MKRRNKAITCLSLLLAAAVATHQVDKRWVDLRDKTIPVEVDGKDMQVPAYGILNLRPLRCSAYVRKAAHELFGIHYSLSPAWDRRYNDQLVTTLQDGQTLEQLTKQGVLQPGMVVSFFNPDSGYNGETDSKGQPVDCTHNALYLGIVDGEPLFAEQYFAKTGTRTEQEMRQAGLVPIDVIDAKQ